VTRESGSGSILDSAGVETPAVLSWIFRNRSRVQIVYGTLAPPPLAGARFEPAQDGAASGVRASGDSPRPARPGELRRLRKGVELRPMPRRVG
jgi:hypothetical protein